MQRTVSACSHAAFVHGKPGNAEEKRSPTKLVWPVRGWLASGSVREQELSVILKASVRLNMEITKMKTEVSVH